MLKGLLFVGGASAALVLAVVLTMEFKSAERVGQNTPETRQSALELCERVAEFSRQRGNPEPACD